jgi:uncharacterized protein YgbK (DUF1537 family)
MSTSLKPPDAQLPLRNSDGLVAVFYGDDFTGSTDVMEAFVRNGFHCVLFLDVPTREEVAVLGAVDVVGVAGLSRSWSPETMDKELPGVFGRLKKLNAPLFHYKICSTFDSSPQIGSIGRALEIARGTFGEQTIPLVVGAPILKRFTAFGNLFATADGVTYRIDRHPTMAHHPLTPMTESDLRVHLSHQTSLRGELLDVLTLNQSPDQIDDAVDQKVGENPDYLLFDVLEETSLRETGRQLSRLVSKKWDEHQETTVVCGSSGVEYALAEHWNAGTKNAAAASQALATVEPATTLVVVGSRSPVTAAQAEFARENGFLEVPVDPARFLDQPAQVETYRAELVAQVVKHLSSQTNTILTTPPKSGDVPIDGNTLGAQLSLIVKDVARHNLPSRLVVAGGDTSGRVTKALGVHSLRVIGLMAPGAPLCLASLSEGVGASMEICLKGGQVGPPDYFVHLAGVRPKSPLKQPTKERP